MGGGVFGVDLSGGGGVRGGLEWGCLGVDLSGGCLGVDLSGGGGVFGVDLRGGRGCT